MSRTEVLISSNSKYDAEIILRYDLKTPPSFSILNVVLRIINCLFFLETRILLRATIYIHALSVLLLSLLPHTPSTSWWTAQPKGYVYPPSLLLSGPLLRCISVIHPSEILWCLFLNTQRPSRSTSVHLLPRLTSHPDSPSSTTTPTIDGATANTYHTAFDARSRALSGHLAYGLDARLSAGLWCQSALTEYACAYMLAIQYAPCD